MLIGNGHCRAEVRAGELAVPAAPGAGEQLTFRVSAADQESIKAEYLDRTGILRTRLRSKLGTAEILDFAPGFPDRGLAFRPAAVVRLLRPLDGEPELQLAIGSGAEEVVWAGEAGEIRGTNIRLASDLGASWPEGRFRLDRPRALWIAHGPIPSQLAGPPRDAAEDALARTQHAWHRWTESLRLPFEPQSAVLKAAVQLELALDADTGLPAGACDRGGLLTALDLLGCSAELARLATATQAREGLARHHLDRRHGRDARAAVQGLLALPETAAATGDLLAHWNWLRSARLVAVVLDHTDLALAAESAMRRLRSEIEERWDERRSGFLASGDARMDDAAGLAAVRLGFFEPGDPRAQALVSGLAAAASRPELVEALAITGKLAEARAALAAGLGAWEIASVDTAAALVRAAFACARPWG